MKLNTVLFFLAFIAYKTHFYGFARQAIIIIIITVKLKNNDLKNVLKIRYLTFKLKINIVNIFVFMLHNCSAPNIIMFVKSVHNIPE